MRRGDDRIRRGEAESDTIISETHEFCIWQAEGRVTILSCHFFPSLTPFPAFNFSSRYQTSFSPVQIMRRTAESTYLPVRDGTY